MFKEAYELIVALDGKVYKNKDTQMLYGIYKKDNPELFEQIDSFYQQGYIQDAERIAQKHFEGIYKEVGANLFDPFLSLALFDTANKLGSLTALRMFRKVLVNFFDVKIGASFAVEDLAYYYYGLEKGYGLIFNVNMANAIMIERINFDLKSERKTDIVRAERIIAILWGRYDGTIIRG
jgi:hypothetical protein